MGRDQGDRPDGNGAGDVGPGRRFFVPAPGGTPDPPPSSRPAMAPPRRPNAAAPPKGPARPERVGRSGGRPARRWLVVGIPVLVLALIAFFGLRGFGAYRSIQRVDLSAVLDPVSGDTVNYLLVGSDSRSGLNPDVPVGGKSTVTGKRSDTIILLRVGPTGSQMMSVPRDLWVTLADTGRSGRINGAYNAGPANLVKTVKDNLSVPVNHYMEVGFQSFVGLVDALGGVKINVPNPAFDRKSGLDIKTAGTVTLDGRQALAFARSRTYTEIIGGKEVTDPTGDLGREARQQQFLRTALADVGATRNPVTLLGVTRALSSELVIDDSLGLFDLVGLARKLGAADPGAVVLPTRPVRRSGAAVLVLDQPKAAAVLVQFK